LNNPCSKEAYDEIVRSGKLGERQTLVLSLFMESYPQALSATMIVKNLGRGVSENTRNRVSELLDMGFLELTETKKCEFTRRNVGFYRWTGRRIPKQKILSKIVCPCCHGIGEIQKEVFVEDPSGQLDLFGTDVKQGHDRTITPFWDK